VAQRRGLARDPRPAAAGRALWYDDRDIAFLREDRKDAAEIQQIKAASIRQLVDAGYKPESVIKAVESEDMGLLDHSGLYSASSSSHRARRRRP
jgi:hypothetical protein